MQCSKQRRFFVETAAALQTHRYLFQNFTLTFPLGKIAEGEDVASSEPHCICVSQWLLLGCFTGTECPGFREQI